MGAFKTRHLVNSKFNLCVTRTDYEAPMILKAVIFGVSDKPCEFIV